MRAIWLIAGALLPWVLTACLVDGKAAAEPRPLLVAAAADLRFALSELAARYEAERGVRFALTFGSTGQLAQQIEHGAPVDLFFAADEAMVARLARGGHIRPDTVRLYAVGRIVLVASPQASRSLQTLADLADPRVRAVAIAQPDHAPYGRAAREALEHYGLWAALRPRLVFGDNIAQTYQYVETANADAGIVALSLVAGRPGGLPYILIDEQAHQPLRQAAGVGARGAQPEEAQRFLAFVLGPVGRPIMERYGFVVPEDR